MDTSRVYIKTDSDGRVIQIEGEYSLSNFEDLSECILVEQGQPCDRLNHAQSHYLPQPLYDDRGICRYKWTGTEIAERTQAEMDSDYVEPSDVPSQLDRIEAQTMYTALLTDTLLEEVNA